MEHLSLRLDDIELYDEILSKSVPEVEGTAMLVTKDRATVGGAAGALFAFTAELKTGERVLVQAAVTMKLLLTTLRALEARYDENGRLRSMFATPFHK